MYHGAQGRTVFAVGSSIVNGAMYVKSQQWRIRKSNKNVIILLYPQQQMQNLGSVHALVTSQMRLNRAMQTLQYLISHP